MTTATLPTGRPSLPPLVGLPILIVSSCLDRAYDRARGLDSMGYRMAACGEAADAASLVDEFCPEAVVVDPGKDGPSPDELCMRVRQATPVPIVAVGVTGSLAEMTRCFDAGADEYCRPGASPEEVDLRLRAVFRRMAMPVASARPAAHSATLRVGDIEIDQARRVVRKKGKVVSLSPTEFRLLATLAEHHGLVIPSKALIARVWGNQYASETHYLRLYVRYLRQKLEDDPSRPRYIVNRWGSGYALEAPGTAA